MSEVDGLWKHTPGMHRRLVSTTVSQLAFLRGDNPIFPWEKSHWNNTVRAPTISGFRTLLLQGQGRAGSVAVEGGWEGRLGWSVVVVVSSSTRELWLQRQVLDRKTPDFVWTTTSSNARNS